MNAVYCIVQKGSCWTVRLNGKDFGSCLSLAEAARPTLRAAARAYARGCYTHVMVYQDNRFRTLWLNGNFSAKQAA